MELADLGMSTRAIAPVVGVGMTTVKRDVNESRRQVVHDGPPEPTVDDYGRDAIEPAPAHRAVTGLDGKSCIVQRHGAPELRRLATLG